MKIGLLGDLHLTDKCPVNRKDSEYLFTCLEKLEYALSQFSECKFVLQAGDFFDSTKVCYRTVNETMSVIKSHQLPIHCVLGQHDMSFRTPDIRRTPIGVLTKLDNFFILPETTTRIHGVQVTGVNFGQKIPTNVTGILVVHAMIIKNKLWEAQEDFVFGNNLLNDILFDLIISGDNHQNFCINGMDGSLINPGSLMRSSIAQKDHKPCCYVYDTITNQYDEYLIPFEPDYLDTETMEIKKQVDEKLVAYVKELSDRMLETISPLKSLENFMAKNNVEEIIKQKVREYAE